MINTVKAERNIQQKRQAKFKRELKRKNPTIKESDHPITALPHERCDTNLYNNCCINKRGHEGRHTLRAALLTQKQAAMLLHTKAAKEDKQGFQLLLRGDHAVWLEKKERGSRCERHGTSTSLT